MNQLAAEIRAMLIPRFLRRAGNNGNRLYGGPPFGREPFVRPSVREKYRDLDGMDAKALLRAQAVKARKEALLRRAG